MPAPDPAGLGLQGRAVLVIGGASGIGGAAAQLCAAAGAEVTVTDISPSRIGRHVLLDLTDETSIRAGVDGLADTYDVVLSCSGVAEGMPGLERINFIGQRLALELLRDGGRLRAGGAIGVVSSLAGLAWRDEPLMGEFLGIADFAEATRWIAEHDLATYRWSKQAMAAYVCLYARDYLLHGVRINATLPGPTNTPLARSQGDVWLSHAADYRAEIGREAATPEEQAYPLVALCSDGFSHVAGACLTVDIGYTSTVERARL